MTEMDNLLAEWEAAKVAVEKAKLSVRLAQESLSKAINTRDALKGEVDEAWSALTPPEAWLK